MEYCRERGGEESVVGHSTLLLDNSSLEFGVVEATTGEEREERTRGRGRVRETIIDDAARSLPSYNVFIHEF